MRKKDLLYFYDSKAEECAKEWYPNNLLLPIIHDFLKFYRGYQRPLILDLGCGTGHESLRLYSEGANVIGIDISHKSIEIARKLNKYCTFLEIDFFNIDEKLGMFDGIFSSGSLIHCTEKELRIIIKKCSYILKNNGYFLLIMQCGDQDFIHYPEVNGKIIKRVIKKHKEELIIKIFKDLDMHLVNHRLDNLISLPGWNCLIFQKLIIKNAME